MEPAASPGTSDPTRKKMSDWLCHLVFDDQALPVAELREKFVHFREGITKHSTELFVQIVKLLKSMPKSISINAAKPSHALILLQFLLECITQVKPYFLFYDIRYAPSQVALYANQLVSVDMNLLIFSLLVINALL